MNRLNIFYDMETLIKKQIEPTSLEFVEWEIWNNDFSFVGVIKGVCYEV